MSAVLQSPSECIDAREIAPEMKAPRIEGSLLSCLNSERAPLERTCTPPSAHVILSGGSSRSEGSLFQGREMLRSGSA